MKEAAMSRGGSGSWKKASSVKRSGFTTGGSLSAFSVCWSGSGLVHATPVSHVYLSRVYSTLVGLRGDNRCHRFGVSLEQESFWPPQAGRNRAQTSASPRLTCPLDHSSSIP